ncbi:hypothetical protein OS493_017395 [Desmophyllum pertusum]|uniref:Uncharacterized protein n=1 Tax=Desmophyllum pertusum TaxID=174260 RepID=A0A9X0A1F2_9CNID|nr:hypothetical protein OS493_017395 [Desmophyllum pertusum]
MRNLLEAVDPAGDDILCSLDHQDAAVWKMWVKPNLDAKTKKPGTIFPYLTSYEKFLIFVTQTIQPQWSTFFFLKHTKHGSFHIAALVAFFNWCNPPSSKFSTKKLGAPLPIAVSTAMTCGGTSKCTLQKGAVGRVSRETADRCPCWPTTKRKDPGEERKGSLEGKIKEVVPGTRLRPDSAGCWSPSPQQKIAQCGKRFTRIPAACGDGEALQGLG